MFNVGRHRGGVGADFSRLHQPRVNGLGQQRVVEFGDRCCAAPCGDLHQSGRVGHLAVDVDPAEPPPRDRIGDLGAQRLVAEPVPVFEEHQPQIGLHRHARPVEVRHERAKNRSSSNHSSTRASSPGSRKHTSGNTESHSDGCTFLVRSVPGFPYPTTVSTVSQAHTDTNRPDTPIAIDLLFRSK